MIATSTPLELELKDMVTFDRVTKIFTVLK